MLLRACQLGLSMQDLDLVTVGMIYDMYIELSNDNEEYEVEATQEDIDNL